MRFTPHSDQLGKLENRREFPETFVLRFKLSDFTFRTLNFSKKCLRHAHNSSSRRLPFINGSLEKRRDEIWDDYDNDKHVVCIVTYALLQVGSNWSNWTDEILERVAEDLADIHGWKIKVLQTLCKQLQIYFHFFSTVTSWVSEWMIRPV